MSNNKTMSLSFYRESRQNYFGRGDDSDCVMVGDYHPEGGCNGEFAITQPLNNAVRIEMFSDAFHLLQVPALTEALRKMEGCESLDQVEAILTDAGLTDVSHVPPGEASLKTKMLRAAFHSWEIYETLKKVVNLADYEADERSVVARDALAKVEKP